MNNLPLYVLFWTAVPYAIYRSKRRWRTFFVTLGSWFGSAVILAFTAVPFYTRLNAQRMGELTGDVMVLVAGERRDRGDHAVAAWVQSKRRGGGQPCQERQSAA